MPILEIRSLPSQSAFSARQCFSRHALTGCLVVLERDHVAGSLLEPLQEVDDQVADVLRVGAGEGELLAAHSRQRERLLLRLVRPDRGRGVLVLTER